MVAVMSFTFSAESRYIEKKSQYMENATIHRQEQSIMTAVFLSLSMEKALSPRASTTDIGCPFAAGGVLGSRRALIAATTATPAPQ